MQYRELNDEFESYGLPGQSLSPGLSRSTRNLAGDRVHHRGPKVRRRALRLYRGILCPRNCG